VINEVVRFVVICDLPGFCRWQYMDRQWHYHSVETETERAREDIRHHHSTDMNWCPLHVSLRRSRAPQKSFARPGVGQEKPLWLRHGENALWPNRVHLSIDDTYRSIVAVVTCICSHRRRSICSSIVLFTRHQTRRELKQTADVARSAFEALCSLCQLPCCSWNCS
jgi:hypothetical protein